MSCQIIRNTKHSVPIGSNVIYLGGGGGSYGPEEKFTRVHCQNLAGLFVSLVELFQRQLRMHTQICGSNIVFCTF